MSLSWLRGLLAVPLVASVERLNRHLSSLRGALAFFTRLPVTPPSGDIGQGLSLWLPFVGVLAGGLAGLTTALASLIFPPLLASLFGIAAWITFTGGLHLDGVADCGDGLWLAASPERRLEVMRDSRLGTFGALALFILLALKSAALSALVSSLSPLQILLACACAGCLARSAVFVLMRFPSARPGGLGDSLRSSVTPGATALAALSALLAAWLATTTGLPGFAALLLAFVLAVWLGCVARRRLGGVTGDVFGCLVESAECAVLIALCAG